MQRTTHGQPSRADIIVGENHPRLQENRTVIMDGGLEDVAMQAAETLQTAHINHNPTRADLAPDTSVDKKIAVEFDRSGDVDSMAGEVDEDEVPLSILRPLPEDNRHAPRHLQLPDLRFEQSYLKSIENAENWGVVAYITLKDQVSYRERVMLGHV